MRESIAYWIPIRLVNKAIDSLCEWSLVSERTFHAAQSRKLVCEAAKHTNSSMHKDFSTAISTKQQTSCTVGPAPMKQFVVGCFHFMNRNARLDERFWATGCLTGCSRTLSHTELRSCVFPCIADQFTA